VFSISECKVEPAVKASESVEVHVERRTLKS